MVITCIIYSYYCIFAAQTKKTNSYEYTKISFTTALFKRAYLGSS